MTPTPGTGLEGAGRNAQINRRCHAVARKGQKRVLFYAFVTLYRDHFIDGMRNVMTFLFICRAVAEETGTLRTGRFQVNSRSTASSQFTPPIMLEVFIDSDQLAQIQGTKAQS